MSKGLSRHLFRSVLVAAGWLLCALPMSLFSQTVSTEADALSNWMDEYASLPSAPDNDQLPRFTPGWFEEITVRSETDELDINQQRYVLRGEPKMPHVRKAERRVQNAQRAGLNGLSDGLLANGRADALDVLFELATDAREAELIDTLFHVQSRLVDVTRLRVVEPGYDIEKVLDAEDELADIKLRLKELLSLSKSINAPVSAKSLVQLEDIRFRILALRDEGPTTPTSQVAKLEKLDAEMALERAENLSFLKFVQVEYRGTTDEDDLFRDQVSFGGSIAFPRRERHIRQLDKLKVERIEEAYDFELKKQERVRELNDAVFNLQRLFELYDDFKEEIKARFVRRDRLLNSYLTSTTARPESLLRLSRRNLGDNLSLLEIEEDIREKYAALLGDFVTLDAEGIQRWVLK